MVITINVTDQDALICATLADSVKMRLQKFITDYRTSKARVDLEYNQKLYGEAREKYEQARNRYATYADSHRSVSSQSAQTKESDLQNEMQMQQQIYQQVVAQLKQAEMKVQQETPAFTTLQSATVPVLKAGPKRAQMCLSVLHIYQAASVSHAYLIIAQRQLSLGRKVQETQIIGNSRTVLSDLLTQLFVSKLTLFNKCVVREGNLHRVEVFALDILN